MQHLRPHPRPTESQFAFPLDPQVICTQIKFWDFLKGALSSRSRCSKGNQSWIFIGRTDSEAETPILWPPNAKNWLIGEDPDAGKDWRQGEKGTTEGEMVGWYHRLDGHEFAQAPWIGDGERSWCAAVHGVAKSWTRLSNWTELNSRSLTLNPLSFLA